MTIIRAKTRLKVSHPGSLPGGWLEPRRWSQARLGWGPATVAVPFLAGWRRSPSTKASQEAGGCESLSQQARGQVKLIGLMSWYDEDASWLDRRHRQPLPRGMTHLVAVDGAYALFPDGRARSGVEQHRAISETCEGLGISSTIYAPQTVWTGNEVEKRSFMFRLGLAVADGPQDWL
jgi:hypothetical protein